MNTRTEFESFFADKKLALIGVSRDPKKFSRMVYNELLKKGFELYPVNPGLNDIEGVKVYKDITELPADVRRALFMTPKDVTPTEIRKAAEAGIDNIWVQQGSHSQESLNTLDELNVNAIHKKCIMMFAGPVKGVHGFHRFLAKMFGDVPA